MPHHSTPDYSPAGILYPGGNCESSAKPHWCWVSDLCPFGFEKPATSWVADSVGYRYGFNGKELDPVGMGGGGSTYDYGFRIYNPQIAKFLSVDPLFKSFPWYTPYQFAGNMPILFIDLDGLEPAPGDDNYGKNYIFPSMYVYNSMTAEPDPTNTNWLIFPSISYNKAASDIQSIVSSNVSIKVNTVFISMHGAGNESIAQIPGGEGDNYNGSFEIGSAHPNDGGVWIQNSDLKKYIYLIQNGKDQFNVEFPDHDEWLKNEGQYIKDIVAISNMIEEGGNLIFGACDVGKNAEFVELMYVATGSRINIYAARGAVTVRTGSLGNGKFGMTLLERDLIAPENTGWVVAGPSTGGMSKGLENTGENKTDRIVLKKSGDEPFVTQ